MTLSLRLLYNSLMHNRFDPPLRGLSTSVERPRVTDGLRSALIHPIVVVVAAAGYGKTLAGIHLYDLWPGSKAWWSADIASSDPLSCERTLMEAADCAWFGAKADGGAAEGLLVIDLANADVGEATWRTIQERIAHIPASGRLLLLSRTAPPLPLALWASQRRARILDYQYLRLSLAEWRAAGLPGGEDEWKAVDGWWGPALVLAHWPHNPMALVDWLGTAWWVSLNDDEKNCLGMLSLLPEATPWLADRIDIGLGQNAQLILDRLRTSSAVVRVDDGRYLLAPAFRLAVQQLWRRTAPTHVWSSAVMSVVDRLIRHGEYETAAQIAVDIGDDELGRMVLQRCGWTLLFGSGRPRLGILLDRFPVLNDIACTLLTLAWEIEAMKSPHRADKSLRALLPTLHGEEGGQALALMATIAWDFDCFDDARSWAEQALSLFQGDRHPASIHARIILANALTALGHLSEAEACLRLAHACAHRERLIYLQLDCMQRRAYLASERGQPEEAERWNDAVFDLAQEHALPDSSIVDSARRLQSWIYLQRLDADKARAVGAKARPFWDFPQAVHQSQFALFKEDLVTARREIHHIGRSLDERFLTLKWQNQAVYLQIWLAGREQDRGRLHQLEQQLANCEWAPSLHRDRRRVLLAAVRLLADTPQNRPELENLLARLQSQGALALARQLALILALLPEAHEDALLHCVKQSAEAGEAIDYLWLGTRCVLPLERLRAKAELGQDDAAHGFVRTLLDRLLAPVQTVCDRPPPAGLTSKEAQILQLIGQHFSNEQIAARLFISVATVKTHINHIYGKLELSNRTEAIRRARELFG